MPNKDRELIKKRMKATQADITAAAIKQQEEAANADTVTKEKIPFRNADIDRMNAQKKKMF